MNIYSDYNQDLIGDISSDVESSIAWNVLRHYENSSNRNSKQYEPIIKTWKINEDTVLTLSRTCYLTSWGYVSKQCYYQDPANIIDIPKYKQKVFGPRRSKMNCYLSSVITKYLLNNQTKQIQDANSLLSKQGCIINECNLEELDNKDGEFYCFTLRPDSDQRWTLNGREIIPAEAREVENGSLCCVTFIMKVKLKDDLKNLLISLSCIEADFDSYEEEVAKNILRRELGLNQDDVVTLDRLL